MVRRPAEFRREHRRTPPLPYKTRQVWHSVPVQLVSISLYSVRGDRKDIPFELGKLNIITGQSKTGKSVLVKLIDYCMGRSLIPTSAGNVEKSLAWVGALWQLEDGSRAFVGRPIPNRVTENSQAMLLFGNATLQPPEAGSLRPDTNTVQLRFELGARIGITESRIDPAAGSLRPALRTHLGHAALLCLQNQDEISSSTRIFHRSGERGIDDALRDTIPYFLGAIPADQAALKAMLREHRRRLQRAERDLRQAVRAADEADDDLRAALADAITVGLLAADTVPQDTLGRDDLLSLLRRTARMDDTERVENMTAATDNVPQRLQDARRSADSEVAAAEDELRQLLIQRSQLLDESEGGTDYAAALGIQAGRLVSINLLPAPARTETTTAAHRCPVCGQTGPDMDPTADQMAASLEQIRGSLANVRRASPARSEALDATNEQISQTRSRIARARAAQTADLTATRTVGTDPIRRRDFTRGRINAILTYAPETDPGRIAELQRRVTVAEASVADLEQRLSDDEGRERLNSRLLGVGRDLTRYAQQLELEHSARDVRIDLAKLTIIADVDDNPVPLYRIGSAENWIGYHIASHLALHQSFMRNERPVPRLLVIDQPSQGHYPSDIAKRTGKAASDADEIAVSRLYQLLDTFAKQSNGRFQIIVVDHADIDADWFQAAIVDRWRGENRKLIPEEWLEGL